MKKEKLRLAYPIIVEGKYDKVKLSNIVDTQIITTEGFGVFKKEETRILLRKICAVSPIILLCDSDGGGKIIRSHILGMLPRDKVINLYIPQIKGKEKRKNAPSAQGFLGVEGIDDETLYSILLPYAVTKDGLPQREENPLTMADLHSDGLAGRQNSSALRDALAVKIGLPRGMSAKGLLEALRLVVSYDEYTELVRVCHVELEE